MTEYVVYRPNYGTAKLFRNGDYQKINWDSFEFDKENETNIIKKFVKCDPKKLFRSLNKYLVNDLSDIVMDYLVVNLNVKCNAKLFKEIQEDTFDLHYVDYVLKLNMNNNRAVFIYDGNHEHFQLIDFVCGNYKYKIDFEYHWIGDLEYIKLTCNEFEFKFELFPNKVISENEVYDKIREIIGENQMNILDDFGYIYNSHLNYLIRNGIVYHYHK